MVSRPPAPAVSPRFKAALVVLGLLALAVGVLALWPAPARQGALPTPEPQKLPVVRIPMADAPRTERDARPALLAWARRNLLDSYDRVGLRGAAWNAPAREYIAGEVMPALGRKHGAAPAAQRLDLGRRVLELGCRDPLVLYLVGRHLWAEDEGPAESLDLLRRALAGFQRVRYPRGVARMAASTLRAAQELAESEGPWAQQAMTLERRWFEESLADGSYEPGESEVLVWQLTRDGSFFDRHRDAALAALSRSPAVDEWARLYFSGTSHFDRAWDARGGSYADEVPEAVWPLFHDEAQRARDDLARAWQLRPDRPEAAAEMVGVAVDAPVPGETPQLWFERAVTAQFDYLRAYERLFYRLQPQWGGSHEEMMGLGLAAAATRRYDTDVPRFLLWALDECMSDQLERARRAGPAAPPPRYAVDMPGVQAAVREVLDGYLSSPNAPDEPGVYESIAAIMADRGSRLRESRQHLERIGFRLHPITLWRVRRMAEVVEGRGAALGGAMAPALARAQQARTKGGLAAARPFYEEALTLDSEPAARKHVLDQLAGFEREERLAQGEWVSLQPRHPELEGWGLRQGTARLEDDGSLSLTSGWRGTWLASFVRLGASFEAGARIEFGASSNGVARTGLLFGDPGREPESWASLRLRRLATGAGRVELALGRRGRRVERAASVRLRASNQVELRCQDRSVTVTVNGTVALRDVPLDPELRLPADTGFALGAGIDDNVSEVRYRDVRVRRLGPPDAR